MSAQLISGPRRSPSLKVAGTTNSPAQVERPKTKATSLEKRLTQKVGAAIAEHGLISDGDRIMVCVSGGKDSYALVDLLLLMQRRAPIRFDIVAVNIDQGWPGYETDVIRRHLESRGVEHRMVNAHEIAGIVERVLRPEETGATPCSLCSRLRRGVLYGVASELGATKIALGHHFDDAAETLLLNLFFAGALRGMPAKYVADDGRHTVIRPMIFVEEKDLVAYSEAQAYPTVRCSCPTCGLPEQQRQQMKRMLNGLEAQHPALKSQMLAAMRNVQPESLLDLELSALRSAVVARDAQEPV